MGSKNCPESPRQKMIGMMYLFLTAMLAINVDPTILNSFSKVDESLRTSVENFGQQNRLVYSRFKDQLDKNETKVRELYDKAEDVKKQSAEMIKYLQGFKDSIAVLADGEESKGPDSIANVGDQDIATTYLLSPLVKPEKRKGAQMKQAISEYRENLMAMIDDAGTKHIIESSLATHPTGGGDDHGGHGKTEGPITWEMELFDGRPVIAAVAMLTKIQNDVKNAESVTINHLFNKIGATDFKVNTLEAYIIPKSTYIRKGGKFEAQIGISAFDDTQLPRIEVKGNPGSLLSDNKTYEISANSVGEKTVSGRVWVMNPVTGEAEPYDFKDVTYEVYEPFSAISATKMNVVYAGVDNPLDVAVPGVSASDVTIKSDNGVVRKSPDGNGFIIKPANLGIVNFSIYAEEEGKTVQVGPVKSFRVKSLPPPTPFIAVPIKVKNAEGKYVDEIQKFDGGTIRKKALSDALFVGAELKDADFEVKYEVTSFQLKTINSLGNVENITVTGNELNQKLKSKILSEASGKSIFIANIKVMGPDKREKTLPMLEAILN